MSAHDPDGCPPYCALCRVQKANDAREAIGNRLTAARLDMRMRAAAPSFPPLNPFAEVQPLSAGIKFVVAILSAAAVLGLIVAVAWSPL